MESQCTQPRRRARLERRNLSLPLLLDTSTRRSLIRKRGRVKRKSSESSDRQQGSFKWRPQGGSNSPPENVKAQNKGISGAYTIA